MAKTIELDFSENIPSRFQMVLGYILLESLNIHKKRKNMSLVWLRKCLGIWTDTMHFEQSTMLGLLNKSLAIQRSIRVNYMIRPKRFSNTYALPCGEGWIIKKIMIALIYQLCPLSVEKSRQYPFSLCSLNFLPPLTVLSSNYP